MGNTCAGLGFSRSGLSVIWWTRADHAIKCDDKEICNRNLDDKPNHHKIHVKAPVHAVMIVQDKTELSVSLGSQQDFRVAEKPTETQKLKEDSELVEAQSCKVEEEENSVKQPKIAEVKTGPIQSRIPQGESRNGAGQAGGNKIETQAVKQVIYKNPHSVKSIPSVGLHMESVLQTKKGYFKEFYSLGKKIGHGQYGTTFICFEKSSGKEFACKCIPKRKLVTMENVKDVRKEIQIMHHLAGHPNIIEIKGAYEDPVTVFVIMDLCTGGELFDRVSKRGHYTEKKAAALARTILSTVAYCHSLGVFHRDLKPENFLFVNEEEDSPMKTIDFGLSEFFNQGDTFSDVVGSPYYVAPEVLSRSYGPEADVWSAGVIVYILLCGVPPFWGENDDELFQEIMQEKLDFSFDPWPEVSESAKDFIRKVLNRNPRKRLSAYEALRHPWIREDGMALDKPLDSAVLSRLKKFSAMNKLKKMAIRIIAERLTDEEIAGLKEMFKAIDTDSSGQITFEELKVGLKRFGANISETEIHELLKAADLDNSGTIDYGEFVAATLHLHKVKREDHLFAAFSYFDKDGSGFITQDELQQACDELGVEEVHLEEMIQEVDQDNDGCIDYNEFVAMMQKENAELGRKSLKYSISTGVRESLPVF